MAPHVAGQIIGIRDPLRGKVSTAAKALRNNPHPEHSIASLTTVPELSRHAVENYRIIYMVFPAVRLIAIGDVIIRNGETYAPEQLAHALREAKALRKAYRKKNPAVSA